MVPTNFDSVTVARDMVRDARNSGAKDEFIDCVVVCGVVRRNCNAMISAT